MYLFESLMLICFGISWPISIAKAIRTKEVSGKSPLFLGIIMLGYASGIIHKVMNSMDMVIILYVVNIIFVGIDLFLYYHYQKKS